MLMKPKASAISAAVLAALGTLSISATAQTAQLERIEITGSSIKRIASEGALPVQVISAEELRSTGATSVQDVIQRLPSMQGFTIADIAIGSNSGGRASASIHDIGEEYTLVLLNGRRLAPQGSGSAVNLNAIPMSAIERIEVLTDGASALYGSDAIAGVVNFVLKRNHKGGNLTAQVDVPLEGGGESANASITYGFGDLDKDRFNIVATYRRDEQKQMKSGDREFADSAYLPFTLNGKNYAYDRTSTFADPANATVTFRNPAGSPALPSYSFNPYHKANGGQCAPLNVYSLANARTATSISEMCAFDFVSTIDIYPESSRDSLFLSGQAKLNDKVTLFTDVAYTRLDLIARIAPNPVPVTIPVTSSLFTKYVAPYLTAEQLSRVNTVSASYRATDFGTRDSQTITEGKHVVIGGDAEVGNWSLNGAFTWSQNAIDEKYTGGYFKTKEFNDIIRNVAIDPFVQSGNQTAAAQQLIAGSIFNGSIRTSSTTLKGVDFRASGDIFKLPAGMASLGVGGDFRNYHYKQTPAAAAVAGEIYNYAAVAPYDLKRDNIGVFAEMLLPVAKDFELTAALRHDTIKAIKDGVLNKTVGKDESAATYKLSGRYQLSNKWLMRGSYGTGFKAPSMLALAEPLVPAGVTAASYECPFPNTDACKPGKLQYSVLRGGNENLKPEKSKQLTIGVRFEPANSFSIGADYWQVKMRDAVSAVSADQAFGNPTLYSNLFTTYKTPAETQLYYAFKQMSTNIGQAIYKGIDWELEGRTQIAGIGRLTTALSGTYMIDASYTMPGTRDQFTTSLGKYGINQAVTFRNILQATFKLESGAFTNTLRVKYRSGYTDFSALARDLSTGVNVRVANEVPDYMTLDWQGVYKHSKALEFRVGVNNLLNQDPPFTLRESSGHQVGYDPRYADPKMRTVYLVGSYNF